MELPAMIQTNGVQTLMTRAYRERLSGLRQDVNSIASATLRIRLPEGLVLQGEFSAGASPSRLAQHRCSCGTWSACVILGGTL